MKPIHFCHGWVILGGFRAAKQWILLVKYRMKTTKFTKIIPKFGLKRRKTKWLGEFNKVHESMYCANYNRLKVYNCAL